MAQYIKKDALVAEIDRRLHQLTDASFDSMIGRNLIEIKDFLDTLEVKELGVDLGDPKGDKSARHIIDTKTLEVKEVNLDKELANYNREYVDENGFFNTEHLAKHFYELGLKVQKGE